MQVIEQILWGLLAFVFGVLVSAWWVRYSAPFCHDLPRDSVKKELCYSVGDRDDF